MAIIITDDTIAKAQINPDTLVIDIACYLYERKRLSLGQARALTGLHFQAFQAELGKREIDQHYSEEDLATDLRNLGIDL